MNKPYELSAAFKELEPNEELLEKLYRKNQKEYIRRRLRAIKLLWAGKSRNEVENICQVTGRSLINWLKVMVELGVEQGLRQLAQETVVQRAGKLSVEQQLEVIRIIQEEQPSAYGYSSNLFTGAILAEIVAQKWQIQVTDQTIYNLLARHRFSYQRAHRDYGAADRGAQESYQEELKKNWST